MCVCYSRIFASLKLCVQKEINFFRCFLVTLLNPTCSWFRPRTILLAYFVLYITQVCHCRPVWAVFENLSLSFWVSLFVLKTNTVPLFSQISPSVFFTCLSFIVLNGWKKSFLAAELFGRLKNVCYLLVLEWTKRSLSDVGKMNDPGQLVTCLTPDDLQVFNVLISIFRLTRFKPWMTWERRNRS